MGNSLLFRLKVIGGALGFVVIAGLIYWCAKAKQKLDNAFARAGSN
jgi:hypothetical protein